MHRRIFCIFVALLGYIMSFAYDEIQTPSFPVKLPQSPNVEDFPTYGEIPVDYYTGTVNVTIPIFEIDIDGCKIPIAITYHSTGIKVAQHASNVGLGWQLCCGGIITSDCYGRNDFECGNGGYVCNNFADGIPDDSHLEYYGKTNQGVDITQIDTRPDLYHYSFCGNNGDMFFPPHELNRPTLINQDKYLDITYIHDNQTWTIYDGNGNRFHFGNKCHHSMNASFFNPPIIGAESSLDVVDNPALGGYDWNYSSVNAWPLDSIWTMRGRRIVFKYRRESILTPMMPQEEVRIAHIADYGPCNVPDRWNYFSHCASNIIQSVPTEITFPTGKVTFYTSSRFDVWDGVYSIYSDAGTPTKMDSIIVTDYSGNIIKRALFYYHYAGSISSPNTCRLILDSIGGLEERVYKFSYYETDLPKKNSRQIDMWGFYNNSTAQRTWSTTWSNNQIAEGTLMPSMIFDNRTFYGRNRQCNAQKICNASLKEIIYPTGGKSQFEYEPHTFPPLHTDAEIINDEVISKRSCLIISVNLANGSVSNITPADMDTITLLEDDVIDVYVSSEAVFSGPSNPVDIAALKIMTLDGVVKFQNTIKLYSTSHEYTFHPVMEAGTYIISLTYNGASSIVLPNPGFVTQSEEILVCKNVIYKIKNRDGNTISNGGGLRIKSITLYDRSDSVVQRRMFTYQLNDTLSSGKLFVIPRFAQIFHEEFPHKIYPTITNCGNYFVTLASSSTLVPSQPMINPTVIGYSKVTETIVPESENGRTEYIFDNLGANAPSEFPNFAAVPSFRNGTLRGCNVYNANGSLRQKKEFSYSYRGGKMISGLHTIKLFPERYYIAGAQQVDNVRMSKYFIQSMENSQQNITTTDYLYGDSMVTNSINMYDTINHLPIQTLLYLGNDTICNSYIYPLNSSSIAAQTLTESHLYNNIMQQTTINKSEKTTADYLYEDFSSMVLLKEIRKMHNGNNSDSLIVFTVRSYDSHGNPTCVEDRSHIPTAYLWGCNSTYPIIEVIGATYQQIEASIPADFLNMLENSCMLSTSMLKSVYNMLSTAIPHGSIHVYTYQPNVGISAEIDARGVVYSYEYDKYNRLIAKYMEKDLKRIVIEKYNYHFQEQ